MVDKSLSSTWVITKDEATQGSNHTIRQHKVGDVTVILPHPTYNHNNPSWHLSFNNLFYLFLFLLFPLTKWWATNRTFAVNVRVNTHKHKQPPQQSREVINFLSQDSLNNLRKLITTFLKLGSFKVWIILWLTLNVHPRNETRRDRTPCFSC